MKGELARAEVLLAQTHQELNRLSALSAEKQAQLRVMMSDLKAASASGDPDRLLRAQQHIALYQKAISEIDQSQALCLKRIDSAERYIVGVKAKLADLNKQAAVAAHDCNRLARLQLQISAIVGDDA